MISETQKILPNRWWTTQSFHVFILGAITSIVMWPCLQNGWVNWDDPAYVLQNLLIRDLSFNGLVKMFSTLQVVGLYHPLTLISLALDYSISGLAPVPYHFTSLFLHVLNTCLLYYFMRQLGSSTFVALSVALLFGIHPMHVESVAWASARKDVLYTFFYLMGLISYLRFTVASGSRKTLFYVLCFVSMLLSVLSKASAVTFPVILILIDYLRLKDFNRFRLVEKLPFFVVSVVFGIVAIYAQRAGSALENLSEASALTSTVVAAYCLFLYVVKAIIPFNLVPFHPYVFDDISSVQWYMYVSGIIVIFLGVLTLKSRSKHLIFGTLFFLVAIAPNIQLVPYGMAMMAERYSYVSYIGLFYVLAISTERFFGAARKEWIKKGVTGLVVIYVIYLSMTTMGQITVWENGETLWSRVIKSYPDHFYAYYNRGDYYLRQNQYALSQQDFETSIQLNAGYSDTYNRRGVLYQKVGSDTLALMDFNQAINLDPENFRAYLNRSISHQKTGVLGYAKSDLDSAITYRPDYALAYLNRGVVYESLKQYSEALTDYDIAIQLEPKNPIFFRYRGLVYYILKEESRAMADMSHAIALKEDYGEAYFLRSVMYRDRKDMISALTDAGYAMESGYLPDSVYIKSLQDMIKNDGGTILKN